MFLLWCSLKVLLLESTIVNVYFYFDQLTVCIRQDGFEGANRLFLAKWERWPNSLTWQPWSCHHFVSFIMKSIMKIQLEPWKKIKFHLLV